MRSIRPRSRMGVSVDIEGHTRLPLPDTPRPRSPIPLRSPVRLLGWRRTRRRSSSCSAWSSTLRQSTPARSASRPLPSGDPPGFRRLRDSSDRSTPGGDLERAQPEPMQDLVREAPEPHRVELPGGVVDRVETVHPLEDEPVRVGEEMPKRGDRQGRGHLTRCQLDHAVWRNEKTGCEGPAWRAEKTASAGCIRIPIASCSAIA